MRITRLAFLLCSVLCPHLSTAHAGPIYVFKEKDGTVRFTNRPPPAGVPAKVFKPREAGFSTYRVSKGRALGGRLFRHEYSDIIMRASVDHGVPVALIRAVIHTESAFNPRAISPKGAQGLMQLMPAIAKHLGVGNPFSPAENIRGGVKHLAFLLKRYGGDRRRALAAYNAGEDAVERYQGIPPFAETKEYVRRVLELERRYAASQ